MEEISFLSAVFSSSPTQCLNISISELAVYQAKLPDHAAVTELAGEAPQAGPPHPCVPGQVDHLQQRDRVQAFPCDISSSPY